MTTHHKLNNIVTELFIQSIMLYKTECIDKQTAPCSLCCALSEALRTAKAEANTAPVLKQFNELNHILAALLPQVEALSERSPRLAACLKRAEEFKQSVWGSNDYLTQTFHPLERTLS